MEIKDIKNKTNLIIYNKIKDEIQFESNIIEKNLFKNNNNNILSK